MLTQKELPPIPENPEKAMWSFFQDYQETAAELAENPVKFDPEHPHDPDPLTHLAQTIGLFAVSKNLELTRYIAASGLNAEILEEQIQNDEFLAGQQTLKA